MSDLSQWKKALADPQSRKKYEAYVKDWEKKTGAFIDFSFKDADKAEGSSHELSGLPFGVKDNIAVKGFRLTCGSKMLQNLVSPYTATAVAKLQKCGAVVVGKTNLDEFGMGSSTDNSALKKTNNPWDAERVAGGSSGGSAAAVAAGQVPFALGTDTGGSVRQPAAFCGVYGLKPTYGVVSRYGLTAYASSLEVIGVLARSVSLTESVFNAIRGEDPCDQSSVAWKEADRSVKTVACLKVPAGALSPEVEKGYAESRKRLESIGYKTTEFSLPTMDFVVPAYYTIATAEASANLARFNGIRYGFAPDFAENPVDLMRKSRHNGFGPEVKQRILLGTYVLRSGFQDQYYIKAQKIRTAIRNDLAGVFKSADLILMPVFPTTAFHHGASDLDSFQQKVADVYTCMANLAGYPALAIPAGVEKGLPVGVQLMAAPFGEGKLFEAASACEKLCPVPAPAGYSTDWS